MNPVFLSLLSMISRDSIPIPLSKSPCRVTWPTTLRSSTTRRSWPRATSSLSPTTWPITSLT
eukprot:1766314-Pleurochrysis_carterae.AAC.1